MPGTIVPLTPGQPPAPPRLSPGTLLLILATVACYAVGYPLALAAGWFLGWILVTLGGVLLFVLAAVIIKQVHAAQRQPVITDER